MLASAGNHHASAPPASELVFQALLEADLVLIFGALRQRGRSLPVGTAGDGVLGPDERGEKQKHRKVTKHSTYFRPLWAGKVVVIREERWKNSGRPLGA